MQLRFDVPVATPSCARSPVFVPFHVVRTNGTRSRRQRSSARSMSTAASGPVSSSPAARKQQGRRCHHPRRPPARDAARQGHGTVSGCSHAKTRSPPGTSRASARPGRNTSGHLLGRDASPPSDSTARRHERGSPVEDSKASRSPEWARATTARSSALGSGAASLWLGLIANLVRRRKFHAQPLRRHPAPGFETEMARPLQIRAMSARDRLSFPAPFIHGDLTGGSLDALVYSSDARGGCRFPVACARSPRPEG